MKKLTFLHIARSLIPVSLVVVIFSALTLTAQEPPFQAPFDFDAFLSELEGALAKIEEEEKTKKPGSQASTPVSQSEEKSTTTSDKSGVAQSTTTSSAEKRDPASLFVDPAVQTLTPKTGPKTVEPTKDSIDAYSIIMDEFTNHLSAIKSKIGNLPQLSPSFKEEFSLFYQHLIDTIVIAHQQIKSRKAYQRLFLAPPEASKQLVIDMKKLRTMILDTAKKIKKLDAQLVIKPQDEEVESSEDLLRKLASQYQDTEIAPVVPKIAPHKSPTKPWPPRFTNQSITPEKKGE